MPYLTLTRKLDLDECTRLALNAGELNYVLTRAVLTYCNRRGITYGTINDALGALEAAKLEFYRRVAVPYEEAKRAQNGDVYE